MITTAAFLTRAIDYFIEIIRPHETFNLKAIQFIFPFPRDPYLSSDYTGES